MAREHDNKYSALYLSDFLNFWFSNYSSFYQFSVLASWVCLSLKCVSYVLYSERVCVFSVGFVCMCFCSRSACLLAFQLIFSFFLSFSVSCHFRTSEHSSASVPEFFSSHFFVCLGIRDRSKNTHLLAIFRFSLFLFTFFYSKYV